MPTTFRPNKHTQSKFKFVLLFRNQLALSKYTGFYRINNLSKTLETFKDHLGNPIIILANCDFILNFNNSSFVFKNLKICENNLPGLLVGRKDFSKFTNFKNHKFSRKSTFENFELFCSISESCEKIEEVVNFELLNKLEDKSSV